MPNNKDEDGLVALVLCKKEAEIRNQQQQLVESLHKILGSNQTLSVNVEGVKTMPDDQYVMCTENLLFVSLWLLPDALCNSFATCSLSFSSRETYICFLVYVCPPA